ncbi:MAG TPA: ATP-dependent RNA helicase HrpA [Sporichthyaceae bacterium]
MAGIGELRAALDSLSLREAHHLGRRLDRLARRRGASDDAALAALARDIEAGAARLSARRDSVPSVHYPDDLPISARREQIAAAIAAHQVVIVAGETGSGKTTQIPKICLELGRGIRGQIGHTQPRRLAARTVADRVAEELGIELGELVGYTVRFTDRAGENTLLRLMTDGILLAQIQRDRLLLGYDTLIIDEAHERSLNIDFLLGYLHQLLPRRPDLKLIITSATIDPDRFARHFTCDGQPAPIIEVSGRTYPVEIRYRPLVPDDGVDGPSATASGRDDEPSDQATGMCAAVEELLGEKPGDILVFLSGEREIRDTADALRASLSGVTPAVDILPLYARLSIADQHRVFAPHPGRRIVLATNVAETSLTVPGIRYVVDAGTARISRYSTRRKVQRLPIEPISRASANQRAGRCGRVAPGVCIRLYSESDFAGRPEFTEPEILRTHLASVILQMTALGLGAIENFPFLEPPDRRAIADGMLLLAELGAVASATGAPKLTEVGRKLAALPVDPRIGRMIVEADSLGALREVIVIAAALSIQDPREYPPDKLDAARAAHARFADPGSDFLAWLNLWRYLREQQRAMSSAAFRRLCAREHLHWLRVREWQDLVAQLRELAAGIGLRWQSVSAPEDQVHRALLAGLVTMVGMRDPAAPETGRGTVFLGTRNTRFAVFPGSALARRPPRWVMAAELVETARLFARTVARVQPEWIEQAAGHLVTRNYAEPHWERKRGAVVALERVTLYGLPLVVGRRVNYAGIDPVLCRELFLRAALVEGDWTTHHRFFAHNQQLRAQAAELEERARRRGLVIDDHQVFDFYDARVPADVVSARHFDAWWKNERREHPHLLDLDPALLHAAAAEAVRVEDFPDSWRQGALELPLHYEFLPGTEFDGVTVDVPLSVLNRVRGSGFEWQVPGLREDLVVALIRALPKAMRRSFTPPTTYAAAVLPRLDPTRGESLTVVLQRELGERNGVHIDPEDWDWSRVPSYLRPTFRVCDDSGAVLAVGKDLAALRNELEPALQELVAAGTDALERTGLRGWPPTGAAGGAIPDTHEQLRDGQVVRGYPALVDENGTVALRVLTDAETARAAMWSGTRRLVQTQVPPPIKAVLGELSNPAKLALAAAPHATGATLLADCADAAVDAIMAAHGGPARDAAGFAALVQAVRAELPAGLRRVVANVGTILTVAQEVDTALAAAARGPFAAPVTDMRAQYDGLLFPGFVTATGAAHLGQLPRYLRGIARRLERLPADPVRDEARMGTVTQLSREYAQFRTALPAARRDDPDVRDIRWQLEELRISLFAQTLGTAGPVSEKRILAAMDAAESR